MTELSSQPTSNGAMSEDNIAEIASRFSNPTKPPAPPREVKNSRAQLGLVSDDEAQRLAAETDAADAAAEALALFDDVNERTVQAIILQAFCHRWNHMRGGILIGHGDIGRLFTAWQSALACRPDNANTV